MLDIGDRKVNKAIMQVIIHIKVSMLHKGSVLHVYFMLIFKIYIFSYQ